MNWTIPAFGAVALVVGLAVDYSSQAGKAGAGVTEFSLGEYVASYSSRYTGMKAEQAAAAEQSEYEARVRAGAKVFLPEAPEGWTRTAWVDADTSRIDPPRKVSAEEAQLTESLASTPVGALVVAHSKAGSVKNKGDVYQRGDDTVYLEMRHRRPFANNTMSGLAAQMVQGNIGQMARLEPYAMIQGVPFAIQTKQIIDNDPDADIPDHQKRRRIVGYLGFGDEVEITVKAIASDEAIREILMAIDYDGLNTLLAQPLEKVGSNADDISPGTEKFHAVVAFKLRDERLRRQSVAAERAMINSDPLELALNQVNANGNIRLTKEDLEQAKSMASSEQKEAKAQGLETKPEPRRKVQVDTENDLTNLINDHIDTGTTDAAKEAREILDAVQYSQETLSTYTPEELRALRVGLLEQRYTPLWHTLMREAKEPQTAKAESPQEKGGFFSSLFGGDDSANTSSKPQVKISSRGAIGSGGCSMLGAAKRCKVGE